VDLRDLALFLGHDLNVGRRELARHRGQGRDAPVGVGWTRSRRGARVRRGGGVYGQSEAKDPPEAKDPKAKLPSRAGLPKKRPSTLKKKALPPDNSGPGAGPTPASGDGSTLPSLRRPRRLELDPRAGSGPRAARNEARDEGRPVTS
jgi:hypothetical protein